LTFLIYSALQSANAAVGTGVTVQVYAWAENVKVAGPSVGFTMQADEYQEDFSGKISGPASAVSDFAKQFVGIPIISEFATATQLGARAVAIGARALGFSNPPVLNNSVPMRSVPFPQLASTEVSYPVEKLTVDSKNELTVDPKTVGLNGQDELSMRYLCQRESYLTTASWATTNVADDILFYSAVSPCLFDSDALTDRKVYMTPMCWIAQLFNYWRGDIIFRFRFIASQFHKGRVRLSFDPAGNLSNITSDAFNSGIIFTKIIDLGKETDIELRVPYVQALPWLNGQNFPLQTSSILWSTSSTPSTKHTLGQTNGGIIIRVLTALSAPVATSTVKILVSVRGAENLEFADPCPPYVDLNQAVWSAPQSDIQELMAGDEESEPIKLIAGSVNVPRSERYLVNHGEHIVSLRQLLRRHYLSRVSPIGVPTFNIAFWKQTMHRFPTYPGYYTNGWDSAKHIDGTAGTLGYNYNFMTPINWIMPAFIAARGSMSWAFNVDNVGAIGQFRVYRNPGHSITSVTVGTNATAYTTDSAATRYFSVNSASGSAGQSITNQNTQAGIAVELPNYNNFRFNSTTPALTNSPNDRDGSSYDTDIIEVSVSTNNVTTAGVCRMWQYVGIGTDFSLHFFLNVPTLFVYRSIPTSN
jgi:hypothetical protein